MIDESPFWVRFFFICFDSIIPPTASAATVTTRFSIGFSLKRWYVMGYAVIRVFVVKLSEFLNGRRAVEMRSDTAELGEVAA
jgi:hypothetical protein